MVPGRPPRLVGTLGRSVAVLACVGAACSRALPADHAPAPPAETSVPAPSTTAAALPAVADAQVDVEVEPHVDARVPAVARALPLEPGRTVYYALPTRTDGAPSRLVGHLHGICYPPSYSAGRWLGAATDVGALVCPQGNARCGDAALGPPSWEASSWEELVAIMDADLERSIAKVLARHSGSLRREGAVLTGFSRGAYAAPVIARAHPGRWPFLVLIEANVPLAAASLRKSGVRAVALVAGEVGTEIAGERKTTAALVEAGFPARLFVMPKVAHLYPDDMEAIMASALSFVLEHEADAGSP